MKNDKMTDYKKVIVLKRILEDGTVLKKTIGENSSNSKELTLKNVELYEPIRYEDLLKLNKKKYRDLKIKILSDYLRKAIENTYYAIDLYKELKDKTEYWEKESTLDFNFKDWNTIKKVNGKLTRYYKELKEVQRNIERSNK